MHVIRRRGWEIPESHATPEHLFLNRRAFLTATGVAAIPPLLLSEGLPEFVTIGRSAKNH